MTSILMIDDDVALTQLVAEYLQLDGYQFKAVHQGPEGLELAKSNTFQLVLLDIMLPGMDGLTVLKQLRQHSYCPVLMLTARGDEIDKVVGLELGADDYLAKPFSPRELVARIKAILRRVELIQHQQQPQLSALQVNGLRLDSAKRQVLVGEQPLILTATEYQILELLLRHAGDVVSKEDLSQLALGKRLQLYDRSLDMHISNIRKKIAQYDEGEKIQTLRGLGYVLLEGEQ
ncbi:DNA-binding response regulator [Rheinheimera mesophila]|uniref:DNA-binding response regulator n=1 Tax=Rheinheimera mesophila TaxID=1547515 RepID=A0A3P3QST0_9GAMM|nr:response regulator transcription factor [Rheinheimera mesophila]KKL01670.1 chemotaxis protein CheY [Rheinheimera mesophila]RRJ23828.1 DNA-binding response regulator [Rheinheimera mesophila]